MSITVPKLSQQLHEALAALANDPSILVERVYSSLTRLDGYQALAPAVREDIFQSISRSADLWFQLLLTGAPHSDSVIAESEDSARRRVHQHVPLQSLLRAVQLGAREVWRACTELGHADKTLANELLFQVSPYLFDYFDQVTQIITKAYEVEQYQQARWRDSILHQLRTVVFQAPDDSESFTEAVHALGLDATLPRFALVIDATLGVLPPDIRNAELDRQALSISHHFRVAPEMLVQVWHRGRAVLWVPCHRGGTISQCDRTAFDCAQQTGAADRSIRAIGIGLMNHGAAGWATSATEAVRAIEFAPPDPAQGKVYRYSSIALEESVRGTENVLRYLVSLVEQLSNEPDLLTTLTMFFAEGRRRRATADALCIHPNTLTYRLERVESLLGASLDDIEWVAKLDIALKLYRTLPKQTGSLTGNAD